MRNHIFAGDVDKLQGNAPYRDGECVALVQALTSIGHTSMWRPGPRVVDLSYLNPGTVIANFKFNRLGVGYFPNEHGYHAALFVEFGPRLMSNGRATSIVMMDQWKNRKPEDIVKARTVPARGDRSHAQGNAYHDSENADQFYVVVA